MALDSKGISVIAISALSILVLYVSLVPSNDGKILEDLQISATYEDGLATITYSDRTKLGDMVVMEILGLDETFQKTYYFANFTEMVPFADSPKYGWAVHPIVLDISHPEYGNLRLKTEIRPAGEPAAPVIISP